MKTPSKARKTTLPGGMDSSTPSVSVCDDLQGRIAARAHELYMKRGCGDGYALDDWVQAEREILSQIPSV
jgi:hypothetical protein